MGYQAVVFADEKHGESVAVPYNVATKGKEAIKDYIQEELEIKKVVREAAQEVESDICLQARKPVTHKVTTITYFDLHTQTGLDLHPSDKIYEIDDENAKVLGSELIKVVADYDDSVKNESNRDLYQELRNLLSGASSPLPDLDAIIRTVREHDSNKSE